MCRASKQNTAQLGKRRDLIGSARANTVVTHPRLSGIGYREISVCVDRPTEILRVLIPVHLTWRGDMGRDHRDGITADINPFCSERSELFNVLGIATLLSYLANWEE